MKECSGGLTSQKADRSSRLTSQKTLVGAPLDFHSSHDGVLPLQWTLAIALPPPRTCAGCTPPRTWRGAFPSSAPPSEPTS
jgi:hypothetical protein